MNILFVFYRVVVVVVIVVIMWFNDDSRSVLAWIFVGLSFNQCPWLFLCHRSGADMYHFLCKWKDGAADTWEPLEHVSM